MQGNFLLDKNQKQMKISPTPISHDRLIQVKQIEQNHDQFIDDKKTRYFIYEIDDNRWQDVNPLGETEYDLQSIKQEPAQIPVGILTVDQETDTFSFEGDLTITQEDLDLIFQSTK